MLFKLALYFKLQFKLFLSLLIISVVPYFINQIFLNKLIPNLNLLLIVMLFGIKILFFKDSMYKKNIKKNLRAKLLKETKRPPTNKMIQERIIDMIHARDAMLITNGVIILILSILI